MATDRPHLDRARAEGFGGSAAEYDRHRPRYPVELIDEFVAIQPTNVLDVGCGTGLVALPLIERGIVVLGVEPDHRMASVARARGVPVETGGFEQWNDAGRRFDLITCGAAWHWIEPEQGVAKAATVLRSGGTLARFWNYHLLDDAMLSRLDSVYAQHAPEASTDGRPPPDRSTDDPIAASPSFAGTRSRVIRGSRRFSTNEWLAMVSTLSDHVALGSERLRKLVGAMGAMVEEEFGGLLHATSCTRVSLANRI